MKEKCFSSDACSKINHLKTVDEIFSRLDDTFGVSDFYLESILHNLRTHPAVPESDYIKLEKYYHSVLGIMIEVRDHSQWRHFATLTNTMMITRKLPNQEMERWRERSRHTLEHLRMDELMLFVKDRLEAVTYMADRRRGWSGEKQDNKQVSDGKFRNNGNGKKAQSNAANSNSKKFEDCPIPGCKGGSHPRWRCPTWGSLDVNTRLDIAQNKKRCLMAECSADKNCQLLQNSRWRGCIYCRTKDHCSALHQDGTDGKGNLNGSEQAKGGSGSGSGADSDSEDDEFFDCNENFSTEKVEEVVLKEAEKIEIGGREATVLYDTGTTHSLVTPSFAAKQVVQGRRTFSNIVCWMAQGAEKGGVAKRQHLLPVKTEKGVVQREFLETDFDHKSRDVDQDLKERAFPGISCFAAQEGKTDAVFGMDQADLFPSLEACRGKLRISKSKVSEKFLISGTLNEKTFEEKVEKWEPLKIFENFSKKQGAEKGEGIPEKAPEPKKPLPQGPGEDDLLDAKASREAKRLKRGGSSLVLNVFMSFLFLGCLTNVSESFLAYDCLDKGNVVTAYSLLEPGTCHLSGMDHKHERILSTEIVQMKKERSLPVFRCMVTESLVSQYCGHFSAAGVMRFLQFREPKNVEPSVCRGALKNGGKIKLDGREFQAEIGTTTSHSFFVTGNLDENSACKSGTLEVQNSKFEDQTSQRIFEVTLHQELGFAQDLDDVLKLSGGLVARLSDHSLQDSQMGTYVWEEAHLDCPEQIVQLYRGPMRFFVNSTGSPSLEGGLAVLDKNSQVAGLELSSSFSICSHTGWRTHLKGISVVIHGDNFSSIASANFDPSVVSDITRVESEMSFLNIRHAISQREKLRQIKLAICEDRRQILMTRLEAIAGSENPYSLLQILGKGHLVTRAGATVYVNKCKSVSVEPRVHENCTHEIPALFNGTAVFVDPLSFVIRYVGTVTHCNAIAPPRYLISGRWYCGTPALTECHAPENLPLSEPKISDWDESRMGLGRSIYSPDQIHQFNVFQQIQGARTAFLAEQTGIAFQSKNEKGEWGLALSEHAKSMMLDTIGKNFIPLYRFLGPISITIILILFVIGLVRILGTFIFRVLVLVSLHGCGVWVLGAVWGALFQILVSPIRWADKAAKEVADRVEEHVNAPGATLYPQQQLEDARVQTWRAAMDLFKKSAPAMEERREPSDPGSNV